MGCPVCFCKTCGDEMIHKYRRGAHESSSPIGQFLHKWATKEMTVTDIDAGGFKRERALLRILEHKNPSHGWMYGQTEFMGLLDILIRMGIKTPSDELRDYLRSSSRRFNPNKPLESLDPRSGVFAVSGEIVRNDDGHPSFKGAQVIASMFDKDKVGRTSDQMKFCSWFSGDAQWESNDNMDRLR